MKSSQIAEWDRRVKKFGKLKRESLGTAAWIRKNHPDFNDLAERQHSCGRQLNYRVDCITGKSYPQSGKYCQLRLLCPLCAWRRAVRTASRMIPSILDLLTMDYRIAFLTLTQRVQSDCYESYRALTDGWQRWWHRACQSRRRLDGACQLANVEGGHRFVDTKFSAKEKGWHTHLHVLVAYRDSIDEETLRDEWSQQLGYAAQIELQDLYAFREHDAGRIDLYEFRHKIAGDIFRIVQYAMKSPDLTVELAWHAYLELCRKTRTRFSDCFGLLRRKPDSLAGRLVQPDWTTTSYTDASWKFSHGYYCREQFTTR